MGAENPPPNLWMVRPCELYKEEYRDCKSIRAKFHQLFTTGEAKDCTEWKEDYLNCLQWEKKMDQSAVEKIVDNEKKRIRKRVTAVLENNVWSLRNSPPADWNDPLPEHLAKLQKEQPKFRS